LLAATRFKERKTVFRHLQSYVLPVHAVRAVCAVCAVCMSNSTTHPARIRIMDHGLRIPRCGPLGLTSATICIAKLHIKILWSGSLSRLPVPGSNFRPLVVAKDQRDQREVLGTGARPHSHGDRCVLAQHTSKAVNFRITFAIPERIGTQEEFAQPIPSSVEAPATIPSAHQSAHKSTVFASPSSIARTSILKSHRGIPLVQESFPDTSQVVAEKHIIA